MAVPREETIEPNHRRRRRRSLPAVSLIAAAAALTVLACYLTLLHVPRSAAKPAPSGVTRTYYIAADHVRWNYAPDGRNDITGAPFDDTANTYVAAGPDRIGSTYLKSLYREYTDDTFATLKPRPAA
jgi:hypothetical protein